MALKLNAYLWYFHLSVEQRKYQITMFKLGQVCEWGRCREEVFSLPPGRIAKPLHVREGPHQNEGTGYLSLEREIDRLLVFYL